jgi:predicted nucleic acid-binding protein
MRIILDTNLWSSIRDEETERSFDALMNSRGLRVVVPPSTLMEVVRIPVAEARQQVIHALATGKRDRLPTEAESESMEVVSEVRRVRVQWMRTIPDTARTWSLNNFWTKKIWREALRDSQRLYDYEMREAPLRDYLVDHQKKDRDSFLQSDFQVGPLTGLMITADPNASDAYLAGWSGEPVEFWRLLLRDLYWHQLSVIAGRAVLTREDTTTADWVGAYADLSKLGNDHEDFTRFWLKDVDRTNIPRNWLRCAVRTAQAYYKITPGNPADEQHSSYLFDCDLFLSADSRYISTLEFVRESSPFNFAEPRLVNGDRNIPIVDRLEAAI